MLLNIPCLSPLYPTCFSCTRFCQTTRAKHFRLSALGEPVQHNYTFTHGLAASSKLNLKQKPQTIFFSLNVDEGTNNSVNKMVNILVRYFEGEEVKSGNCQKYSWSYYWLSSGWHWNFKILPEQIVYYDIEKSPKVIPFFFWDADTFGDSRFSHFEALSKQLPPDARCHRAALQVNGPFTCLLFCILVEGRTATQKVLVHVNFVRIFI